MTFTPTPAATGFRQQDRRHKIRLAPPTATDRLIDALYASGQLKVMVRWISERFLEFQIHTDAKGNLYCEGKPISRNHVSCMIRHDFQAQFPGETTPKAFDAILAFTWTRMNAEAQERLKELENGPADSP
jgi:hypothetical protein